MASATAAAAAERTGALSHRQVLTILTGLLLGMFLGALDQTIVATAIRRIGDDLNGLSVQAWVTTGFLITSTIATPLYGKLSDIYGRKPLFLIAISIFILGSALCGLASSMYMLAAFRAFQGLGAGGLFSLAFAIMADIVSPQERPRYMGYFMATFATSSVLGPLIGGFLSGQNSILGVTGWRWIFYVNVPIGLLALVVVMRVLHLPHHRREHRIDWQGAAALVAGLVPLLIVAEQGREWGWASSSAFACYLIGVFGLAAFVWVEGRMGDEALIPLRLFRVGPFSVGAAQSFVIGIGMFGGIACIPLYLQIVKGASPTKAGLLTLPLVAGLMVASMGAGQFTSRTGRYKLFPIAGSVLLVASLVLLNTVGADTPLWRTDIYMALFGLGIGLNMQTIQLAMQNAVRPRDMGVATSSGIFFRQVGGTLGTAVFLSILFSAAPHRIAAQYTSAQQTPEFQAAAQAHPDQLKLLSGGHASLNDTSFLSRMDDVLAHPFRAGFSQAMDLVFITGALALLVAVVLSLCIKEVPLRRVSGMEAARMEVEAAHAGDPGGATH
jgi:EmrB/QacA subfamily drug resistance transporter